MARIVEFNSFLLSALPLQAQEFIKSLPLPDISLFLVTGILGVCLVHWLIHIPSEHPFEPYAEFQQVSDTDGTKVEKQVKVKIPNTKKNRRSLKKKSKDIEVEKIVLEESKELVTDDIQEGGWQTVKPKNPKNKKE